MDLYLPYIGTLNIIKLAVNCICSNAVYIVTYVHVQVTTLVDLLPSSQGDCCDFSGGVWKSAVKDLSSFISKGI